MPTATPMPTKSSGEVLTSSLWNTYVRDNIDKLLTRGHRFVTVAQFAALTGLEDGDEVYLQVDATNGIYWHLRYDAASASTYKWVFLGGPPLVSEIATSETTTSAAYTDLATAGPSKGAPRGGDYDLGGYVGYATASVGGQAYAAIKIGAAATADAEAVMVAGQGGSGTITSYAGGGSVIRRTLAASGDVAKMQYKEAAAGTGSFAARRLTMRPVRIRHDG